MKRTYRLAHDEARRRAAQDCMTADDGWCVTLQEPSRSLEQNSAQWPLLEAFARQKQLIVNGQLEWATADDWKNILTATFKAEMRVAFFEGKMILLGQRTSLMGKKEFSDWLEYLHAMAAQMGVELQELEAA